MFYIPKFTRKKLRSEILLEIPQKYNEDYWDHNWKKQELNEEEYKTNQTKK